MTVAELEQKLEGAAETQRLEFKGACRWNVNTYAKDILALANVQDGGEIVVGVENESFRRQGVTSDDRDSYRVDLMRDQMARFADPHVIFNVEFASDSGGLQFVVIRVRQFDDIPVICRCDDGSAGTRAGALYYRNLNRRSESAPVSNSYDMRAIIESAAIRMSQRWNRLGLKATPSIDERLDAELGGN